MNEQTNAGNSIEASIFTAQSQGTSAPVSPNPSPDSQGPSTKTNVLFCDAFLVSRRATGPRSAFGKERSKRNALKHGILAKAVLLKGESRSEFNAFLKGLFEAIQPEGALEETLVQKLAMDLWRYRRFLISVTAEVSRSNEFLEWDKEREQTEDAYRITNARSQKGEWAGIDSDGGLLRRIANPEILDLCIELLGALRNNIKARGFDQPSDDRVLTKIYGLGQSLHQTLCKKYDVWQKMANCSEKRRKENGYASPEEYAARMVAVIDAEIEKLVQYRQAQREIDSAKIALDKRRGLIPATPNLDLFSRYETHIDRSIDRTLSQLERLQRMRLGQPIPPPIKIDVSRS
jgi:hypothetical protein